LQVRLLIVGKEGIISADGACLVLFARLPSSPASCLFPIFSLVHHTCLLLFIMSSSSCPSELPSPMSTPRAVTVGLPVVQDTPVTPMLNKQEVRKRAREEKHLQYLEEERLDDERAITSMIRRTINLGLVPSETVKIGFEDLDGLSHDTCIHLSPPGPPQPNEPNATLVAYSYATRHVSLPPLTPDATIRAAVQAGRRGHIPSAFKVPGSPQLDMPVSRKSSRRAAVRRRNSECNCRAAYSLNVST